jgi:hypothetical protein
MIKSKIQMYSLASAALADSLKQQVGSVQLRVPTSFPQRLGAALYVFLCAVD